jgi:hypothetical protein
MMKSIITFGRKTGSDQEISGTSQITQSWKKRQRTAIRILDPS